MPYTLLTVPTGKKAFKKLPQAIARHIYEKLQALTEDPQRGSQLKGKHRHLRSLHTRYKNTDYRVIYQVQSSSQEIIIVYVGSRENLYRTLHQLGITK